MIAWPATLPQTPDYQFSAIPNCGLGDPDEDRNPVRKRTYPEYSAEFAFKKITTAQWTTLRGFWAADSASGKAPFSAPWLEDIDFNHHFLRFVAAPEVEAHGGGLWSATIRVEIIADVPTNAETGVVYWAEGGIP